MAGLLNFIGSATCSGNVKNSFSYYSLPFTFSIFVAFSLLVCVNVKAQEEGEENIPANLAPPALKILSKEEKSALAGVSDIKNRTKLALDLMEVRLKKAEELNTQESFGALLTELGSFHALMDDALKFLNRNDDGRGKVMSTFKRFEMTLRTFMPRLELIRRDLPERYEYHVRRLLKTVRDTRSKAVEPFFSTTIVPTKDN
jgi:hypothetical protein